MCRGAGGGFRADGRGFAIVCGARDPPHMKKPPNGGLFGTLGDRRLGGLGLLGGGAAALDEAGTEILADFLQALGPADDFEQGVALAGGLHHVAAEREIGVGQT